MPELRGRPPSGAAPSRGITPAQIADFRARAVALERQMRAVTMRGIEEHRSLSTDERESVLRAKEEIRGIKETLRRFGALHE